MNDQTFLCGYMLAAVLTVDFLLLRDRVSAGSLVVLVGRAIGVAVLLAPLAYAYGSPALIAVAVVAVPWFALTFRGLGPLAPRRDEGEWSPAGALWMLAEVAVSLAVILVAWLAIRDAPLNTWLAGNFTQPHPAASEEVTHWLGFGFMVWSLLIANSVAGSRLVALVLPPEADRPAVEAPTGARAGYRLRLGPFSTRIEPEPIPPIHEPDSVGATIGVMERLLIVVLILGRVEAAIGLVVAAKTIARFKQLDERHFAERYLVGTLASVTIAVATGLIARSALLGS
jgi:hypothetical protein